ncbi:MAG TPA: protein kinase [Myxococcota bacterium]|nr:protein kinase [Myxococcota bacterium]
MDSTSIQSIGRYRIDREIGSGGMALAYRCVLDGPSGFQKYVLVKMLQPDHRDSSHYYGMFLDEARLCARLQHPNIPSVFELGEHEDLPFLVMEYVDGPNLVLLHRKFRDGHRRHYGHLALIFQRIAQALHHAHTLKDADGKPLKIVHRDVSLANVLVGKDGHAKLIDFGIAKWEQSETITEVDVLKGKLRYMAPEQFQKTTLDGRVDIYQLGVAMYWLGTGRPPFGSAAGVTEIQARFSTAPPRPSTIVHGFPPGFEAIILKCLEPKADNRYATASDLAIALEQFIRSDPAYTSTEAGVALWIQELFPGNELETYMSKSPTGSVGAGYTRPVSGSTGENVTGGSRMGPPHTGTHSFPAPDDRIGAQGWIGLVGVAVVAAFLGVQLNDWRRGSGSNADNLLTAAEAALEEKNYMAARKYLMKVDKMKDKSEEVEEHLAELETQLERAKMIEEARRMADVGNNQAAIATLTKLLAEMPADNEANRLLKELQMKTPPAIPPPP